MDPYLEAIFQIPDLFVGILDERGKILEVNEAALEFINSDKEELKGEDFWETPWWDHSKELQEKLKEDIQKAKEGNEVRFEAEHYSPSGEKIIVDFILQAIDFEKGNIRLLALGRDITEKKEAQQNLEQKARLLRQTEELTEVGGWEYDLEEDEIYWTDKLFDLHGFSKEGMKGHVQESLQCYPSEARKKVETAFREAVEDGEPYDLEVPFVTAEGEELWVRTIGRPVEENGEIKRVIGTFADITDLKRMRENLKESEAKYRHIVEQSHDAIYIYRENRFEFVNERSAEITGYNKDELYELNIWDLVHPEDREQVKEIGRKRARGKEAPSTYEARIVRKDGEVRTCEFAVSTIEYNGEQAALGMARDITERKKAERKLRQSEKRFKELAGLLPLPIWEADTEGKITYLNQAGLEAFGYSKDKLEEGVSITDFVAPSDKDRALFNFQKVLRGEEINDSEYTLVKKDGTKFPALAFSSPVVRDDEVRGIRGAVLDITEQKEAEGRLKQATLGTLQALNRTIEARDEYTGEHIDRVQKVSVRIGKELDLNEERLEQLRYASILHDVGKIGVPDSILGKPGKLTEEEWEKMEKHPKMGERIVGQVDQLSWAARIIGQHQEHYDGTGYPEGLQEEEITLEARIIAVADAWDAMRTERPYREALSKEEAINELKENAGTQFDPQIVEIVLDMVEGEEVDLTRPS
ncbi:MAG: PAS domain S-box protein [Candidatus Bipolaricaulia bacterium]